MTGTTIAQAIPIAISPILTRLYTPEDFGVFALFISLVSIFGSIANGRYEFAIMLPKKDEDAINIFALGFIINVALSLFLLLMVIVFHDLFISLLNNKEISLWLYLVPFSVFLIGCFNLLNYYNNRLKNYKDLAKANVYKSVVTAVVQLSIGFIKQSTIGLISGQIISQIFANTKLLRNIIKDKILLLKISKVKMIAVANKYKDFPKFNVPHAVMNTLSSNMPVLIINFFFGSTSTGFFAIANKVLLLPVGLFTSSFSQIFLQKITYNRNNRIDQEKFINKVVFKLLGYSFFPFFIAFIFLPNIFGIIFGKNWIIAGEYAQILIPMLYLTFTGSILSNIIIVYNEQKKAFKIEIINTIVKLFSLLFGGILEDLKLGLFLYSLSGVLITTYRIIWYKSIIREKNEI